MFNAIQSFFGFKQNLSKEAFFAYYHKLPNKVQVSWTKDENMIVGKVVAGPYEYFTQGKNTEDFIEMVNDSIYTVFDIPIEYQKEIKKFKTYNPPILAKQKLQDIDVNNSIFQFEKNEEILKVA